MVEVRHDRMLAGLLYHREFYDTRVADLQRNIYVLCFHSSSDEPQKPHDVKNGNEMPRLKKIKNDVKGFVSSWKRLS